MTADNSSNAGASNAGPEPSPTSQADAQGITDSSAQPGSLSKPVLVLGTMMLIIGLLLTGPSLLNSIRFRKVSGHVIEAFAEPQSDGSVAIAFCYRYRIDPGDLSGYPEGAYALGYQRCDTFANPTADLLLTDAQLAWDYIDRLRQSGFPPIRVYYDPDEPIVSARAPIAARGDVMLTMESFGMLLILSPLLSWTVLLSLRSMGTWYRQRSARSALTAQEDRHDG